MVSDLSALTDSEGNLRSDPKVMSELLQAQYTKALSVPRETYPLIPSLMIPSQSLLFVYNYQTFQSYKCHQS